jgi:hypothetical protein
MTALSSEPPTGQVDEVMPSLLNVCSLVPVHGSTANHKSDLRAGVGEEQLYTNVILLQFNSSVDPRGIAAS